MTRTLFIMVTVSALTWGCGGNPIAPSDGSSTIAAASPQVSAVMSAETPDAAPALPVTDTGGPSVGATTPDAGLPATTRDGYAPELQDYDWRDKAQGTVHIVNKSTEELKYLLASWRVPTPFDYEHQVFLDLMAVSAKPGAVTLTVLLPECGPYQLDLYPGITADDVASGRVDIHPFSGINPLSHASGDVGTTCAPPPPPPPPPPSCVGVTAVISVIGPPSATAIFYLPQPALIGFASYTVPNVPYRWPQPVFDVGGDRVFPAGTHTITIRAPGGRAQLDAYCGRTHVPLIDEHDDYDASTLLAGVLDGIGE